LKARTREDSVTVDTCGGVGEGAVAGGIAEGVGGAGVGLCANATELNASPRAVIFRGDGMCIGNTSTCHRATGLPFLEATEALQSLRFDGLEAFGTLGPGRKSHTWCADCVRSFSIAEALST
jgi:hypothetical protein